MRILPLFPLKISIFLIFLASCIVPVPEVIAYPEGELYWATEEYPNNTFLYDSEESYTGAVAALDYACQQYSGSNGTYTGEVRIDASANDYPAQKGGWCRNHHPYVGTVDGAYYTAYLYCNGIQRDMFDDSTPCEAPVPTLDQNKNLGKPPCQ